MIMELNTALCSLLLGLIRLTLCSAEEENKVGHVLTPCTVFLPQIPDTFEHRNGNKRIEIIQIGK